jgi:hypothetical protein
MEVANVTASVVAGVASPAKVAIARCAVVAMSFCTINGALANDCPGPDGSFNSFLARFTDDIEFQRHRVVDPLVYRTGSLYQQTTDVELWAVDKVQALKTPLVMSRKQRRRFGILQTITFVTADYAQAHFEKPEADSYRLALTFRKIDGCWYLEQLFDASL